MIPLSDVTATMFPWQPWDNFTGPNNLFDNDRKTIAHTLEKGSITIDISMPKTITSVIFMNRGEWVEVKTLDGWLKRLNHTLVKLYNSQNESALCGTVHLNYLERYGITLVNCTNWSFRTKRIVLSTETFLNFAELRICTFKG